MKVPAGTAEELVTFANLARALVAYRRSRVFVDDPFRRLLAGDDNALSESAKVGALLFFGEAGYQTTVANQEWEGKLLLCGRMSAGYRVGCRGYEAPCGATMCR